MKLLLLAVIAAFTCGCAPTKMLVHLESGSVVECAATGTTSGRRLSGFLLGEISVSNCARQYEALGYVPVENLTDQQKKDFTPATIHRSETQLPQSPQNNTQLPIPPLPNPTQKNNFYCTQTGPNTSYCY